jgi:hypothetical protein
LFGCGKGFYTGRGNQRGDIPGDGERNQPRATLRAPQKRWIYYRKQTKYETKVQTNFELLAMI